MKEEIKVVLNGSDGKMGKLLTELISADKRFSLVSSHDAKNVLSDSFSGDVVVDFSSPPGFENALRISLKHETPFFSGTTGLNPEQKAFLKNASVKIPVFYSPNMSIGVNLLQKILADNLRILKNYDIEIVEAHHRAKKDAPSGTALLLADAAGIESSRIHSIRAADIPGDHWIYFAKPGEMIEFHHRAISREVFARGALEALFWFSERSAGLYSMKDFLSSSL